MSSAITFSGLASGIDSSGLIKSLIDSQRKARVQPLQTKITGLTDTTASFDKLKELLSTLKDAGAKFRELNGGALSKFATSSDETKITAEASNGAVNGAYALSVTQLARTGTSSFNDRFTSEDSIINASINNGASSANRTVSIVVGDGAGAETVAIELTNTTTASQFVSQFNAAGSPAVASLVNVGTSAAPSYAIVINSQDAGLTEGKLTVSVGSEITSAGSGALTSSTLTQAEDALFSVSGISGSITRSSNTINDVISGVTLSLRATGSSTVTVSDDADTSAQTVSDFVDAYNEVLSYIKEKDTVTREEDQSGVTNIFGPLAKTSIDENILTALRSAFSQSSITGGSVNTLADLGITTQRDGTLAFNQDTFKSALSSDQTSVQTITENLGEILSSVDGTIAQFTRFGGILDTESRSYSNQITEANNRINEIEKRLSQEEQSLTARYARLESLISKFNSQQSALAGLV